MQKNIPDFYDDLDKVYIKIWNILSSGLEDRNSSLHLPIFICGKDKIFDGRTVVLRGINKEKKNLWFHTDIRSKKIKILKINSNVSFLFYDKKEKIQLRIFGISKINYQNNISKESWEKTIHMSRQCYLGEKIPGTDTPSPTSGLSDEIDNFKYSIEKSEVGYKNFCVVETFITSIEWLYLAAKGHRRALFELKNESFKKKWIIP